MPELSALLSGIILVFFISEATAGSGNCTEKQAVQRFNSSTAKARCNQLKFKHCGLSGYPRCLYAVCMKKNGRDYKHSYISANNNRLCSSKFKDIIVKDNGDMKIVYK